MRAGHRSGVAARPRASSERKRGRTRRLRGTRCIITVITVPVAAITVVNVSTRNGRAGTNDDVPRARVFAQCSHAAVSKALPVGGSHAAPPTTRRREDSPKTTGPSLCVLIRRTLSQSAERQAEDGTRQIWLRRRTRLRSAQRAACLPSTARRDKGARTKVPRSVPHR